MEFIIACKPDIEQEHEQIKLLLNKAPRLCPIDGDLAFFQNTGVIFASSCNYQKHDNTIYSWDGHGVTEETAFSSGSKKTLHYTSINSYLSYLSGNKKYNAMRGVFTCTTYNIQTGAFSIAVDPMFQYPLFYFHYKETIIISNNIYWINKIAQSFGHQIKRNADSGAMEAIFGIGAGSKTGFDKISLLPHGSIVTGHGKDWQIKTAKTTDYKKQYNYDQLLELSTIRLKEYMLALDNAAKDGDLLFDLTGGQDSRICLAAAIGAGLKNIKVFSGGNDKDEDKIIAHYIAEKTGAKIGNYPQNYNDDIVSYQQLAQTAVYRQQGHSNLYHYDLGNTRLNNVYRVRGGAGELVRFFKPPPLRNNIFWQKPLSHIKRFLGGDKIYQTIVKKYLSNIINKKARISCRWVYEYCLKSRHYTALFKNSFLQKATKTVYDALLAIPENISDIGIELYFTDRAKRHFGFISRALNMSYGVFEPLYDPVLLAAADTLSKEDRKNGKLSFDLIEKLAGKELLEIPFARQSITPEQLVYLSEKLSLSQKKLRATLKTPHNIQTVKIKSASFLNIPSAPTAVNLGMHATYLWNNRQCFLNAINNLPRENECWDIFDKKNVVKALSPNGYFFQNEITATRGLRIFHTILWVSNNENIEAGITKIY